MAGRQDRTQLNYNQETSAYTKPGHLGPAGRGVRSHLRKLLLSISFHQIKYGTTSVVVNDVCWLGTSQYTCLLSISTYI